jgi:hypothetical protein
VGGVRHLNVSTSLALLTSSCDTSATRTYNQKFTREKRCRHQEIGGSGDSPTRDCGFDRAVAATVRSGPENSPDPKSPPELLGPTIRHRSRHRIRSRSNGGAKSPPRWRRLVPKGPENQLRVSPWVIDLTKAIRARLPTPEKPERSVSIVSFLLVANVPDGDCGFCSLATKRLS